MRHVHGVAPHFETVRAEGSSMGSQSRLAAPRHRLRVGLHLGKPNHLVGALSHATRDWRGDRQVIADCERTRSLVAPWHTKADDDRVDLHPRGC